MKNLSSDFKFGLPTQTERGIDLILPHQQSLQVSRHGTGVTLAFVETDRQTAVFELSPDHARHLASLLIKHAEGN